MRRLFAAVLIVLVSLSVDRGFAARDLPISKSDPLTQRQTASRLELLVFEVEGCVHCDAFRRQVLPLYQDGPNAARAPIRFVDINAVDPDKLALSRSLTQVPTVVLMQDGREFDRITGYVGPTNFFRMVDWMLARL